ncbi:hypothetical protein MMC29_002928 [Sticta canariensis]|nr:hypothetical protein [Sticta canariensis]
MAQRSTQERELSRGDFRSYHYTSTTFIKREIPYYKRAKRQNGLPIEDPWLAKRFSNEVAAYQLLKEKTSIPVPRVISSGLDVHGCLYTEMELVPSSVQASVAASVCRMPKQHDMTTVTGPCSYCRDIVRQNVERFVQDKVLPQLRNRKSNTTGLNGCVIPPRWVMEADNRDYWPVKTSSRMNYSFVLHDLTEPNILVDYRTLEVLALIDVEESGYFQPEMQQWQVTREAQFELYENMEVVNRDINLLQ